MSDKRGNTPFDEPSLPIQEALVSQPLPKTKRVPASNTSLLAAAEIIEILNRLPDDRQRKRVLGWVREEFEAEQA